MTATPESFKSTLADLVDRFQKDKGYKSHTYHEPSLQTDFLNPLFLSLGWDVTNQARKILSKREVEVESTVKVESKKKRADYLFRTDGNDRFVCEAKKPSESLFNPRYIFQAKRYAWNKVLPLAILTNFDQTCVYIVGSKPKLDKPDEGLWKTWNHKDYNLIVADLWNLLSKDAVALGSIDELVDSLPKKAKGKHYLIKPDRSKAIDKDFLNILDEERRRLASDLLNKNNRQNLLEGTNLNEAVQRILDRILFLRICEDRDIDTGIYLQDLLRNSISPWKDLVKHFKALDSRPPSSVPFFNGNLFKPHFCEELTVSDEWLSSFLEALSSDESPYLFGVIPVEILGTIYERFLGKIIKPRGKGTTIDDNQQIRHDQGIYYTYQYVVDFIVEQTVGKILQGKHPKDTLKIKIIDPACGSGSFLIAAYDRICEHWLKYFTELPEDKRDRSKCWTDKETKDVHLLPSLKREILLNNIFGVDLDPSAIEVTQLSLYLKMLENEDRATIQLELNLGDKSPLLPPLNNNIKWGNSIIDSSFNPQGLHDNLALHRRVRPFDWKGKDGFPRISENGFDIIIGNPPWGAEFSEEELIYLRNNNKEIIVRMIDSFMYFVFQSCLKLSKRGYLGMILPDVLLYQPDNYKLRRFLLSNFQITHILNMGKVFDEITRPASIIIFKQGNPPNKVISIADFSKLDRASKQTAIFDPSKYETTDQNNISNIPNSVFVTSNPLKYNLWNKINSVPNDLLSDLTDDDGIQRGVSPDLKKAFLVDSKTAKSFKLEKPFLKKTLTGGVHIKRYHIDYPDLFLIYTNPSCDFKQLPNICSFIDQFKSDISCKEVIQKKHPLYSLHRARNENIFLKKQKLIGVITEDELVLALDTRQTYPTDGCYLFGVKDNVDIKYVMAVLNSSLFVYIYRLLAIEKGRVLAQVKPTIIANIPIRKLDSSKNVLNTYHKIVSCVDSIIQWKNDFASSENDNDKELFQRQINSSSYEIDKLVYKLYDLNEDEIKIIEES